MIDFTVEVLKWHFAVYFTVRNWASYKSRVFGRFIAITWGVMFVVHDWLENHLLRFKFEPPLSLFELVTDRMERYKDLYSKDTPQYQWAVEMCEFAEKYDKGHCE